jgi:hypothetical protein
LNPDNLLVKYIPALNVIDAAPHNYKGMESNPSSTGLDGFIKDVKNCNDPLFKQAQMYELDQLYWNPTVEEFNKLGFKYAITLALLYDSSIRYGDDGMQEFVKQAGSTSDEIQFDKNFMKAYTKALVAEGGGDTDRITGFKNLIQQGNFNLITPFTFDAYGESFTINGELGIKTKGGIGFAPVASFSVTSTKGRAPLKVSFNDKSTGSPISWRWSFGDGKYSAAKNPIHKYGKAGKYTVSLTVKNAKGSNTVKKSSYITVS